MLIAVGVVINLGNINQLTPWSKVVREKLVITQLLKFHTF